MIQLLITISILNLLSLSFPLKLALSIILLHSLSKFFELLSTKYYSSKLLEINNKLNLNAKQLIIIYLIFSLISFIINLINFDINYLDLINNITGEEGTGSSSNSQNNNTDT